MEKRTKITVRDLNLYYGENHALKDVNMNIRENCVTAYRTVRMWKINILKNIKPDE